MAVPSYDVDLYSDDAIVNPYPHYVAMRELGPLVFLPHYNVYAMPRYAEVRAAALDHAGFRSGDGVAAYTFQGVVDVRNTLVSDEPLHTRFRDIIGAPLKPPALQPLTQQIENAADDLIRRLVERGSFDGVRDLARYLPLTIVSVLVGLPEAGRERMLEWAAAAFDILGVDNARTQAAFAVAAEMIHYVQTQCRPETVRPDGWAAQIWEAVKQSKITPQEAGVLHVDIVAPSLDTTIFATGHLLHRLAKHPEQWEKLKAEPALIPAAVDEAVRLDSPIRGLYRVVDRDHDIGDSQLPAGARVLLLYASANRDPRHWESPDRFWIERPNLNGHLGFGMGRHMCAGMHLAKLEMRSLLKSIVRRVAWIEVDPPQHQLNNVLYGFASLPTRFRAAT